MSYTIKGIHPITGSPVGFTFNGKSFTTLNHAELHSALSEVLRDNVHLKHQHMMDIMLTKERLFGIEGQLKHINFDKLMEELKTKPVS